MLLATAPLFTNPENRAIAEFALSALGRVRFLSVDSLMALAGPRGLWHVPELVDDWVKAGLVHRGTVQVDALGGQYVDYLALTPLGSRLLESATGHHVPGLSNARLRRSGAKTAHDLSLGEILAGFLALADQGRVVLRGVEADDKRIGTSVLIAAPGLAPERIALQADGLVVTEVDGKPQALLVEFDNDSTSVIRLSKKMRAYLHWRERARGPEVDFGIRALRVLFVAGSQRRLSKLHDTALAANHGRRSGFLLFAELEDLRVPVAERLLGPVARPLGATPNEKVPIVVPGATLAPRAA